jgi:hypothetical protein
VKKTLGMAICLSVLGLVSATQAGIVTFTDNAAEHYIDVMYTVGAGGEFTNWDLRATPSVGSILDPNTNQRSFNTSGGAVPIDTFANTVFSAVNAGPASYVFTEYNPGSAFPPVPAQQSPTAGASLPNPDELNWSIFDTNVGDGNIAGFFPYHMARVVYSPGGAGVVTAQFFDTTNAGVGESFSIAYGIPEPASFALAGMAVVGLLAARRRS